MELQFRKESMPCICEVVSQCKHQELTQEVRLPDSMPDIGRVIGTWGQMLIRGKEWRQDNVGVSGGLMVWILYKPEDGSGCKVVETWIPFNMKVDITGTERDGTITASGGICYQDARSVSARKFMLRLGICLDIQVHAPTDVCIYEPAELPEHIKTKRATYPVKVPAELGEKAFSIDDLLPLPDNCPQVSEIIRYSVTPEIMELKVLGGRLVFRGVARVHVLYEYIDEKLHSYDAEIPFSQFTELDHEYEEGAEAAVWPIITSLEVDLDENKTPRVKASMAGQYIIYNKKMLDIVEDAYSTLCDTELKFEPLQVPVVLQENTHRIRAEGTLDVQASSFVDSDFLISGPTGDYGSGDDLEGRFYILFYDQNDELQSAHIKWAHPSETDCADVKLRVSCAGPVNAKVANNITLQTEVKAHTCCHASRSLEMVSGLVLSEKEEVDGRPSLILSRAGEHDLWTLAKQNRSSVDQICSANGITELQDKNRILIIPVL